MRGSEARSSIYSVSGDWDLGIRGRYLRSDRPFWRYLRPVGRDWRALETSWKGLESLGGLWRGLGTPRSQDFEDVSSRLLDSGGPGTGRAMVVMVILCGFGPPKNRPLRTEDEFSDHRDLRTVLLDPRQDLLSTIIRGFEKVRGLGK